MEKLNPHPEPPSFEAGLSAWLRYVFNYATWVITLPLQLLADAF